MTESEGVIQYKLDYRPGPLPADADLKPLFDWFGRCRARELIGQSRGRYGGYAYGNISLRIAHGFIITGTQTGGKNRLSDQDLAWVHDFDIDANALSASGPTPPSSEAMTHGQIYRALPHANAVIHVHTPVIWTNAQRLGLAQTDPTAGYGTPAMAAEVDRLVRADGAPAKGIFSMGGHEDGIVAYGKDLDEAGELLLATYQRVA
ncbi:class II aldolase/adducin family protein [Thiosocius teredinicola]|uniref:class II aldolase/adducin family protein n=1 Tax=Thiosocius teredinicola TaxID=1973002 RepID=UPI000990CE2C